MGEVLKDWRSPRRRGSYGEQCKERTFFATPYTCALTTSVIPPRTLSSSSAPRASLTTRVLDASPTAPTHPVTQYTASPPFLAWCAKRIRFAVVASMANFRETYLNVTTASSSFTVASIAARISSADIAGIVASGARRGCVPCAALCVGVAAEEARGRTTPSSGYYSNLFFDDPRNC